MALARFLCLALAPLAATPPMGWNSWDCYGNAVNEAQVRANAEYMAKKLARHGWQYVVVDIQWSEPKPQGWEYRPEPQLDMDEFGRLIPAVNRFPSSAGGRGFKPLADYVHSLGLKFGVHIMRGIPRQAVKANLPVHGANVRAAQIADEYSVCPWNGDMYGVDMSRPGAQAYYDSIFQLYAEWGVDFIKVDDIARPTHRQEIAAIRQAIEKSGRPMVLSLSPGPARAADAAFLAQHANMWRVSDDFWDEWRLVRLNFTLLSLWGGVGRPGAWADGDMLPFGRLEFRPGRPGRASRLTLEEQRTVMSLWAIAQSPLIFGGDLPGNDDATNALITNDDVLAVSQKGARRYEFFSTGPKVVWVADAPESGSKYLAVFNVGDSEPVEISVRWRALGLADACVLRDLWERKDLGVVRDGRVFRVAPHAAGIYKLASYFFTR
jgi:alpha-galactosidase